jgi:hypothetical protein
MVDPSTDLTVPSWFAVWANATGAMVRTAANALVRTVRVVKRVSCDIGFILFNGYSGERFPSVWVAWRRSQNCGA